MRADEYESRDDENPFFSDPPAAAPVEESSLSIGEQRRLKDELRRMQDENALKAARRGADLEAQPLLAAPAPAPLTDHAEARSPRRSRTTRARARACPPPRRGTAPGPGRDGAASPRATAPAARCARSSRAATPRRSRGARRRRPDAAVPRGGARAARRRRLPLRAARAPPTGREDAAHVAAARGDADALSVMGFYGLDLNGVDGSGATPLGAASATPSAPSSSSSSRVPCATPRPSRPRARPGFWSARCARSNAGYGDGAPVLACPTVPLEPRCAWPISEQGPLNASLCPRRWAIATAVLAALYATFVTSSGASLGTVEALALVALVSTAAGSYCYYVAATADPGLLRDEPAARRPTPRRSRRSRATATRRGGRRSCSTTGPSFKSRRGSSSISAVHEHGGGDVGAMPKTPSPTLLDDVGLRLAPRVVIDPKPVSLAEILAEMTRVKEDAEAKRLQRVEKRREKRREAAREGRQPARSPDSRRNRASFRRGFEFDEEPPPEPDPWFPVSHTSRRDRDLGFLPMRNTPEEKRAELHERVASRVRVLKEKKREKEKKKGRLGAEDHIELKRLQQGRTRERNSQIQRLLSRPSLSASGLDAKAIKLRRRDAAFEDSDDDIHDLAHNALAHQVPGGLAPAARRKSMVISASAPALGAFAAASG
ncbi:hypothetical protein JL721_3782 [Aureococcus anophagefferens]|nr:hypothetical protein JL721_3782 [Aureococcus anophagefferens]